MAPEVFEYSEQELTGGRQQVQGDKLTGDDGPAGWGEWSVLLRRPRACAGGRVSGGGWDGNCGDDDGCHGAMQQ
jgi:hypothetical protein